MILSDDHIAAIREQGGTDLDVLAWELFFLQEKAPDMAQSIMDSVKGVLAGDALMADKMQAEAGQPGVVPDWFYGACEQLEKQGQTYKTVEEFMKTKVAETAEIAAENQRKGEME